MNCFPNTPAWLYRRALALFIACAAFAPTPLLAQGVTTGALTGVVVRHGFDDSAFTSR